MPRGHNETMLIDAFAPNPDAVEIHSIVIRASPESVYRSLWIADLGGSLIIKLLLGLRSLPGFVLHRGRLTRDRKITLQTIIDSGFGILANEPEEVVLGVTGKFWRPTGNLMPFDRGSFARVVSPGVARAVWNFTMKEDSSGGTILSTETRVVCGDGSSRRRFRMYWLFVRPFSGLIRRLMLRAVKREVDGDSTSK
jgi:hypothetical protein